MTSPLLHLPGAVAGDGIDAPVAAHYGSFNGEQRVLESGEGFVDLSHRDVVRVEGPDRLTWLHSLTTQFFEGLAPGVWTEALVLSPQGHVEHAFAGVDDGTAFVAHTEPGAGQPLVDFLDRMRFMMRVEVTLRDAGTRGGMAPVDGERAATYDFVPRDASRGVRRSSRSGRGIVGLRGTAHRPGRAAPRARHRPPLDPQRARLDRLGRPPREGLLPRAGDRRPRAHARSAAAAADAAPPRRVGEPSARARLGDHRGREGGRLRRHLGPSPRARARSRWRWSSATSPVDAALTVDAMPAAQEVIVDPEVGLHVRPRPVNLDLVEAVADAAASG